MISDILALVAIGSIASVSTAIVLPSIVSELKSATVLSKIKAQKTATKPQPNKNFGASDLVAVTLAIGVVWAITKQTD